MGQVTVQPFLYALSEDTLRWGRPRENAVTPPPQDAEHFAFSGPENPTTTWLPPTPIHLTKYSLSVGPDQTLEGTIGVGRSVDKSWVKKIQE